MLQVSHGALNRRTGPILPFACSHTPVPERSYIALHVQVSTVHALAAKKPNRFAYNTIQILSDHRDGASC
jgi:hypothetical protein